MPAVSCSQCGSSVDPGHNFCAACGSPVGQTPLPTAPAASTPQTAAPPEPGPDNADTVASASPVGNSQVLDFDEPVAGPPRPSGTLGPKLLAGVAAALIVAVFGIVVAGKHSHHSPKLDTSGSQRSAAKAQRCAADVRVTVHRELSALADAISNPGNADPEALTPIQGALVQAWGGYGSVDGEYVHGVVSNAATTAFDAFHAKRQTASLDDAIAAGDNAASSQIQQRCLQAFPN